jgi:hypothetical protein
MATLISVYDSEGLVGRCDTKCYGATDPKCTCVCGGANHGAGVKQATANTQAMAEQWIEEYSKANQLGKDATWRVPAAQLALPL